jgi:hypothetical protein
MKENQLKMMKACQTEDPCKNYGGKVSGCAGSLTSIGGNHKLNPTAAKAYLSMVEAAKKDGVQWGITDSFRPLKIQCNILDWSHFEKTGKKKKVKTAGTPVAFPGNSNHGWGSAVDLKVEFNDTAHKWLTNNASKFGFSNPFKNPRTEPWHWEHVESAKALKSGMTPTDSGGDVTLPTSGDTSTSGTETPKKSGGLMDLLGGGSITSWLDTFMPMKKHKESDLEDTKEEPINEEVDRIKDLIKKVL